MRTNFDRNELRRDRRHALPAFEAVIGPGRFRSINWSFGGLLLEGEELPREGSHVEGLLYLSGNEKTMPFSASVVRADPQSGSLALKFDSLGTAGVDFLDRVVARRLH